MEKRKKTFRDNFRLKNISYFDLVMVGVSIFIWFFLLKFSTGTNENVGTNNTFVGFMVVGLVFGYIILIGLVVGYQKALKDIKLEREKNQQIKMNTVRKQKFENRVNDHE